MWPVVVTLFLTVQLFILKTNFNLNIFPLLTFFVVQPSSQTCISAPIFFAIDKVAVNNFPILLSDILQTPSKKKTISIFFLQTGFFLKSFCRQKLFSLESYWSMIMRRSDNNFSLIAPSREISQLSAETRHLLQK